TCRAVIGADAHQPVNAAFRLGITIGVFAFDEQRRRLNAGLFARAVLDHFNLVAFALGPAGIHSQQHFGPVLALRAARARVDFDVGIVAVSFASEQRLHLVGVSAFRQLFQAAQA